MTNGPTSAIPSVVALAAELRAHGLTDHPLFPRAAYDALHEVKTPLYKEATPPNLHYAWMAVHWTTHIETNPNDYASWVAQALWHLTSDTYWRWNRSMGLIGHTSPALKASAQDVLIEGVNRAFIATLDT